MLVHHLKIDTEFYVAKQKGIKDWEIRLNDRNFQVGDSVVFHEINEEGVCSGRCLGPFKITYILKGTNYQLEGYCTFSHASVENNW